MKTIIDINFSILKDYDSWEKVNPNWNIGDYLYMNCNINEALALSKLYFPNFVEKEGCIILDFRFNEEIFSSWYKKFNGDIKAVEYKCNYYEVADYFESTKNDYEDIEIYNQAIKIFANCLKRSWEVNLKILFPERDMVVEVYDEYDTTRITLYTISSSA